MNFRQWVLNGVSVFLCIVMLGVTSMPTFASEHSWYNGSETHRDNPIDFDNFLEKCSLEERIALIQALRGVDEEINDGCFGKLNGLPELTMFTTDKEKVSQELPLKPETFNEVSPVTVIDAIEKGYLKEEDFSPAKIKEELVRRRYIRSSFSYTIRIA